MIFFVLLCIINLFNLNCKISGWVGVFTIFGGISFFFTLFYLKIFPKIEKEIEIKKNSIDKKNNEEEKDNDNNPSLIYKVKNIKFFTINIFK